MKTLTFQHASNLSRLHDALLAAIPALRPIPMVNPPFPGALTAAMQVESTATTIILTVPDNADEAAIAAVVAAHDPTPDVPPPLPQYGGDDVPLDQIAAGVTQLRAYLALPSPSAAQSAAALKLVIRALLFVLRRLL